MKPVHKSIQLYHFKSLMKELKVLIESKNITYNENADAEDPVSVLTLTTSLLRDKVILCANFFNYIGWAHNYKE